MSRQVPRDRAGALVVEGDTVLLVHRQKKGRDCWVVPDLNLLPPVLKEFLVSAFQHGWPDQPPLLTEE